jgi:hypothetical protein
MDLYVCFHGIDLSPSCLLTSRLLSRRRIAGALLTKGCMQVGHAIWALLSTFISLSIRPPANRHVHAHYPSWTVVEDQWTLFMAPTSTSYHYC